MEDWKEYRLDELYVFGNGLSKGSKYFGYGHPFVSFKTVFNNYFLPEELSDYVDSDEKEQTKCSVQKSDVLLTRTSETVNELGYSCVALRDYPKATFNGFCKRMRPITEGIIHDLYAGYYFRSSHFRNQVCSMSNMVTRASLSNEMLGRLTIKLPSYKTQTQIGELLFSIDRKIALNRQINDNLEQQAQTLYKSWFVDFEPFKDGEFIESELGQIPEGWQCIPFSMFVSESKAKTGKIGIKEYSVTNNGIFPRDAKYNKSLSQSSTKNKLILYGDLVFGMSRDILNWGVMQEEQGGVSSAYTVYNINSGIVNSTYLELFIKSRIHLFSDLIRPAAREGQGIDKSVLQTKVLLCPPQEVLDTFWPLYNSITNQIQTTTTEINCLGDIRDTLLPKLMSGELKINEIDC